MINFINQGTVFETLLPFCKKCRFADDNKNCECCPYGFIKIALDSIPAAIVWPAVRGEWLEPDDDYGYLECSVCEERSPNDERWNFCPNCGADMR